MNEKVQLKPCETYELSRVQSPADYQAIANSSDALEGIEACMEVWIKQIEQVRPRRLVTLFLIGRGQNLRLHI